MKQFLHFCLTRQPHLYKRLLFLKGWGNYNLDKIVFLSLIEDKDVVFDVGANVGYHTLLFSHIVGKEGAVHAFEPVPKTFAILSQFVAEQSHYRNVRLNTAAVGDSHSQAEIHVPGNDLGQASLLKHKSGSWSGSNETTSYITEVITIDDYVKEHSLSKLDFLKLDIEGYELLCLKGAAETLSKFMPLLYIEICSDWLLDFGYRPMDIVTFLQDLGYTRHYLVRDGITKLKDVALQLKGENFSGSANLICSSETKHASRLKNLPLLP
jgi:FkbM family methyltransferase